MPDFKTRPTVNGTLLALEGGAGSPIAAATLSHTTATLADGVAEAFTLAAGKTSVLQMLEVSHACRVRLYRTAAARDADLSRGLTTHPSLAMQRGMLWEDFPAPGDPALHRGGDRLATNGDEPRGVQLYASVTNMSGGSAAITVTLTRVVVEGAGSTVILGDTGLPDPSGEPDDRFVKTAGGIYTLGDAPGSGMDLLSLGRYWRYEEVRAEAGGAGRTSIATPGFTPSGTITSADDAAGIWHNFATATTLGANAGFNISPHARRDWRAEGLWIFKAGANASDLQDVAIKIGFGAGTLGTGAVDNTHAAFLRFTPALGDTRWYFVTNDASGTTGTVLDSGVTPAVDTLYVLRIRLLDASVEFHLGTGASVEQALSSLALAGTSGTTLPGASVSLNLQFSLYNRLAGTARNLKWSRYVLLQR